VVSGAGAGEGGSENSGDEIVIPENRKDLPVNNGDGDRDPKPRTCIRTSAVKIRPDDALLMADLATTTTTVGEKALVLMDFLIVSRGEPYQDRDRLVTQEEVLERQARYAKSNNPAMMSPLFREFFDAVMSNDHNVVISYMSPLYKPDSQIGLKTRVSRKTGQVNEVEPGKLLCRKLLDLGIFPIVTDDLPGIGFYRSAWINAFTAVRSWYQADKAFQEESAKLRAKLDRLDLLIAELSPEYREIGAQFIADMDSVGRRLDSQFAKRWKIIRRALLSGRGSRQGEPEFFEPSRGLWDERDRLSVFIEAESLRRRLSRRPAGTRFPSFEASKVPILLCVSRSNTVPVSLGSYKGAVTGEVVLIDSDDPAATRKHRFSCYRSQYFEELDIVTHAKGGTMVATVRYRKGNRDHVPVTAEIKEPRICRRLGGWYLDLIQGVAVSPATDLLADPKEAFRQIGYFINPKSPVAASEVRHGTRALSVDLGLNPALAFAVYELGQDRTNVDSLEVPGIGWANLQATGKLGGIRDEGYREQIWRFRRRMRVIKQIIRFRGKLVNGASPDELNSRYLDSVLASFSQMEWDYESSPGLLKRMLLDEMIAIRGRYGELHDSTVRRTGIMSEQFDWAAAVREYIQTMKTWRYNGPKTDPASRPDTTGDFARYYRYGAGLRKDVIRKVAAEIRRLAVQHRADVVLVEDLEYFQMSVQYEKKLNSLLSLWSAQTILRWIRNAVEPHGIGVIGIDPRQTSRIDPRTGEFGFYEPVADKSVLLVDRDGDLEILDSDVAAAQNLQRRFWSRNGEIYTLECHQTLDGAVPVLGKQAARYFAAHQGSAAGHIVGAAFVPLSGMRHARMLEEAAREFDSKRYYRHGDRWLDRDTHLGHIRDLFARLSSQASLDERELRFIHRVNEIEDKELRRTSRAQGA
jgi:IS605 OrfB family transposase